MKKRLLIRSGIIVIIEQMKSELKARLLESCRKKKRPYKKKKHWVRPFISRRKEMGASKALCDELATEDPETFKKMMRMNNQKFDELLRLVEPLITKQDTVLRAAIPAITRLQATLFYLATGSNYTTAMELAFRIPEPTLSYMIPEVLKAIITVLSDKIKAPTTEEQWKEIQDDFLLKWNFPYVIGAMDGKHVNIKCPPRSGTKYFNYKGAFSVVLFALVDANYCFRYINVGGHGSEGDAAIFRDSQLNHAIQSPSNPLNIPTDALILGDSAFPLRANLMKPYPVNNANVCQRVFNYRLSRARRVVENAFGILASRFGVFQKSIQLLPENTDLVIQACCCLHNWLRMTSQRDYFPPGSVDVEDTATASITPGNWRNEIKPLLSVQRVGSNNPNPDGTARRDQLADYFFTNGAVSWQMQAIGMEL